jgi:hypothetical protein
MTKMVMVICDLDDFKVSSIVLKHFQKPYPIKQFGRKGIKREPFFLGKLLDCYAYNKLMDVAFVHIKIHHFGQIIYP